ncbi:MAG: hypothetical protein WAM91_09155 [Candidatus Acidiferrales bacterium]
MRKKSYVYLLVAGVLIVGIAVVIHFVGTGTLRTWMMELHGKH